MIAIISYDSPHRKTQDLVYRLILNGYSELKLILLPWVERKNFKPLFVHRPSNVVNVPVDEFCKRLDIDFERVNADDLAACFSGHSFKHILIGGAGILPAGLAENHKVINGHPGYLPCVKGLDALKWSIYHGKPVGVTTHYISAAADEGELIERAIIPVYFEDTFHSVAYRVYETEIDMLVHAISQIENKKATLESLAEATGKANRRMPHELEIIMMQRFQELRKNSSSQHLSPSIIP